MNCPRCEAKTTQTQHKKLSTGTRYVRKCRHCGFEFITIDHGQGQQFVREVGTITVADVTEQQRKAFKQLCRTMAAHPVASKRPDIIRALEICQVVTKTGQGAPAVRSYFK